MSQPTPIRIRPATLPDLIWLRLLYAQMQAEKPLPYPDYREPTSLEAFTASLAQRLESDPRLLVWVAEEGPVVGGFILTEVVDRPVGAPHRYGVCYWLYVVPQWRGTGVGRQLSAAALLAARDRGCESIEIAAAPGDDQWLRRGWTPVAVTLALPLDGVAASLVPTRLPNGHAQEAPDA